MKEKFKFVTMNKIVKQINYLPTRKNNFLFLTNFFPVKPISTEREREGNNEREGKKKRGR